jgi:hypothetical protein
MPQTDQPITPSPKTPSDVPKAKPAKSEKVPPAVYSFTIDTADGRIVMVESVDGEGLRHALTSEEKTKFAKSHPAMPLRQLVEQAFEAGIEFVLGEEAGSDTPESKEDSAISGLLIQTMIEGSKAKALVKSETLERAVIETLISHVAK